MTIEVESPLQRSLDSIDAARRRAYATFIVLWLATFAALLWFTHILRTSDDLKLALSAAVVALVFSNVMVAFAVVIHGTRMTKRILRAIDLATRPSTEF